jgi:hypothetical protein
MSIEFFANSGGRGTGPAITLDKFSRIYLNAGTRDMLGCQGMPIKLYVGYDKVNKRIALAKPDVVRLTDKRPMSFDGKRHYASARTFVKHFGLPNDKTYTYEYVGKENGAYTFELADYDAPDAEYQPEVKEKKSRGKNT